MSHSLQPRIYVACLAAHHKGLTHGIWIHFNQPAHMIHCAIQHMLALSPVEKAEKWAIHAYEDFGGVILRESKSISAISKLAAFISAHGELGAALLNDTDYDLYEAQTLMDDAYQGAYSSEQEFAQLFYEESYEIPEHLAMYIDYKAIAYDLFVSDFFSIELHGEKHIFRSG